MTKKSIYIFFIIFCSFSYTQVNTESMRIFKKNTGISHNLNFDLGYISGNTTLFDFEGGYGLGYKSNNKPISLFLIGNISKSYEENSNIRNLIKNKGFIHARINKKFTKLSSGEFFMQKEFNRFIKLNDRILFGVGIRKKFNPFNKLNLITGVGIMDETEKYSDFSENTIQSIKSTNYINLTWAIGKDISINNIIYYQTDVSNLNWRRILWDGNIYFSVTESFSTIFSINFRYDISPVNPTGNNYFTIKHGFNLSL